MRITKEEDYGISLILALGSIRSKNFLSLQEIGLSYHLSPFFLKRVAKKLKKANLIISKEGSKGGYLLAKSIKKISYGEIIRAISGPIDISPHCCECSKKACSQRKSWQEINNKIAELLDSFIVNKITT